MVSPHGRFAWYELSTTDLEAAKAFYTEVIGWGALDASAPGRAYTLFTAGKATVSGGMELPQDARRAGGRPAWVGYVWVDDVDAAADRVKRLGGVVHVPPTDVPGISRFSIFADPQTARLALFRWQNPGQPQPTDPDVPGRVGWHELLATDSEKALAFYGELFGWQKADAGIGEPASYRLFSAGGQTIGRMVTDPTMPVPLWLFYFKVGDIDAAAQRVQAGGGRILDGPHDAPRGRRVIQCMDAQGAVFALEGMGGRKAVGYFKRVAGDPSDARGRRWSW